MLKTSMGTRGFLFRQMDFIILASGTCTSFGIAQRNFSGLCTRGFRGLKTSSYGGVRPVGLYWKEYYSPGAATSGWAFNACKARGVTCRVFSMT